MNLLNLTSLILVFIGAIHSEVSNTETPLDTKTVVSEQIVWSADRPLTWDDFNGTPDPSTHLHAYTRVSMKSNFVSNTQTTALLNVMGYFEKTNSWVLKDQKTTTLLLHEQRHFDICEIYRRKLMKELEAHDNFNFSNFGQEAQGIFNRVFKAFQDEQARYDRETEHSKIKERQKEWGTFIDGELKKLEKYSGHDVTVKVNS